MSRGSFEPECREELQDAAFMIHGMLEYCKSGAEIVAVGSILHFLEEFDEKASSQSEAAIAIIGQHDEFEHLVREVSLQIVGDAICFGSGENFAPGPSLTDDTLGYDRFWLYRGDTPNNHLLYDWVSYAQLVLEKVISIEGAM
ncbi:hypothetical protein Q4543_21385 [Salipiger sp. 1_MG-2023]|uniref:hypothetical protein n=1 Tax=Salipiger sp. 1_MG-2023 TaxID=3062665 RepID=UPI0026E2A3F0|nr:hypothetical protein [Salipiger sp. 1_MG-2023]MDO6588062.1 hypothetical protein [Salipiger sp. 1_MG-2023]